MRILSALGLSASITLSCTAENAAYQEDADLGTGTELNPATSTNSGSTQGTTSAHSASASQSQGASSSSPSTGDSTTEIETEPDCWRTRIIISTEDLLPAGTVLSEVPVRVETSQLAPVPNLGTLRFYQHDDRLPYELEGIGRFAWVRIEELGEEKTTEFEAIMGTTCPDLPERLPTRSVWSAGYVAVFHFDNGDESPLSFVDSANGIELVADADTQEGQTEWVLGTHIWKLGDGVLEASDLGLDLHDDDEISTLGWVQLENKHAEVLPWNDSDARHRELIAKLPGYRLSAVRGHVGPLSEFAASPFFNLSQSLTDELHDNVLGPDPLEAERWTMLAGTYDGEQMRLFVDGDLITSGNTLYTPGSNTNGSMRVGRWLRGGIDEVRISDVARSADWIRIQHASMTDTLLQYRSREKI
ncbi:MAG: LamG domain-containing protein [Nannocystales bacterium]